MDEFGCCTDTVEDYSVLARQLVDTNICFAWSRDQATAYVVMITRSFVKFGTMPFGGKPTTMVSILLRGSYWFDLYSNSELHPGYVGEKLNLQGEDAENIACLLNGIKAALREIKYTKDEPGVEL